MINPARREQLGETRQFLALRRAEGVRALREQVVPQALDIPPWPGIARAVNDPVGIGRVRLNQCLAQSKAGQGTRWLLATLRTLTMDSDPAW